MLNPAPYVLVVLTYYQETHCSGQYYEDVQENKNKQIS
jgi:hypothetical protein